MIDLKGCLIKKGRYFYAKFRIDGKQVMRTTKVEAKEKNRKKAERIMREIMSAYGTLIYLDSNVLLIPYLKKWLEDVKPLLKPATYESYEKTIKGKINPYFKTRNKRLKDYIPYDFTQYFCYLASCGRTKGKGGLGYKSVKNIRGVLSSAFDFAVKNYIIKENPILNSSMPAFPEEIQREIPQLNAVQVNKLLLCAKENDSHIYLFLLLALFTGLRKGELFALTWDDIDFEKKLLTVNKSRTGSKSSVTVQLTTPKTKSSNRKIPLNNTTIFALKEERLKQQNRKKRDKEKANIDTYNQNDFVIRNKDGEPYTNLSAINRVVNRLTSKAGLPHCTIHGFRHSVATMLDEAGIPLQDISILLGHTSTITTEAIYIKRRTITKEETITALTNTISLPTHF